MDLTHLIPPSRAAARLSSGKRIQRIRSERWIGYIRAQEALARLEELFNWPAKQRMPNLLIVGPTNNGKSMLIEKFRREHPIVEPHDDDLLPEVPVVVVQMPSEPGVGRFYSILLATLGTYTHRHARSVQLEELALARLRNQKVRMIVIDELHNVLAGASDGRREFLNLLRFLRNYLRIPIVGVGTRDAYLAIRSDDQLENRFEPFVLPKWEEDEQLLSLLASFAAALPLRRPSKIATRNMASYILARTEGTIGEIASLYNGGGDRSSQFRRGMHELPNLHIRSIPVAD